MKRIIGLLGILSGVASAQSTLPDTIPFAVIIRDFQPNHSDFENFDDRAKLIAASPLASAAGLGYATTSECFGQYNPPPIDGPGYSSISSACEDGYACGTPKADGTPAMQSFYGMYNCPDGQYNTFKHKALAMNCTQVWAPNPVYVTKGILAPNLIRPSSDPLTWYPIKNPASPLPCHTTNFDQWFKDVPGVNHQIQATMKLARTIDANGKISYVVDSKNMPGRAYFPLDDNTLWADKTAPTFGKQSLDLWCPPYGPNSVGEGWQQPGGDNEPSPSEEKTACKALLAYGGSKNPAAAAAVANAMPAFQAKLHNYAFTMMGYTQFKYRPGDVFEFAGDDDMWVYIDGVLAADLGGTHPAAETRVSMDAISNGAWAPGSSHELHFFYADRQTNSSNLRITTTFYEVIDVPWGAPKIKAAQPYPEDYTFSIDLNNSLSETTLAAMRNSGTNGYFPIIAKHSVQEANGLVVSKYMGLWVQSIVFVDDIKGVKRYKVVGKLCADQRCLDPLQQYPVSTGDSLSFNFFPGAGAQAHPYAMDASQQPIVNTSGTPVKSIVWATVGATLAGVQAVVINPTDKSIVRPEMPDQGSLFENGGVAANGTAYPALGAKGDMLPKNKTGEILLTLYNSDNMDVDSALQTGWGMPPLADKGHVVSTASNNKQYAIGNSDNMTVGHCVSQPGKEGYDNSCLGLGFTVKGPFKINVQVYDHLGHFVSTYQAGIDAETMRKIQSNNIQPNASVCADQALSGPTLKTAKVFANINIYPFSQNGRKLGSGVYILKIDMINEAANYCLASGLTAGPKSEPFGRSYEQIKVAFMRQKTGK